MLQQQELLVLESRNMTADDENDKIRVSRRARLLGNISGKISVAYEDDEKVTGFSKFLDVDACYQEDIDLTKKLKVFNAVNGNIAFVSRETFGNIIDNRAEALVRSGDVDVTIGIDPEFAIRKPGETKCAYATKEMQMSESDANHPRFGPDGPLCEIRPKFSRLTDSIVFHARDALNLGLETNVGSYDWLGGITQNGIAWAGEDRFLQIGGHVHIGFPINNVGVNFGAFTPYLVRVLDELMCIPLAICEGLEGKERRTKQWKNYNYGNWGNYRNKPDKGVPNRFEWRSPSGVWFLSPTFSMYVMRLVKQIADSFYTTLLEEVGDDLDENGAYKFLEYIKNDICQIKLNTQEEYIKLLQEASTGEFKPEVVELASWSLINAIPKLGLNENDVRMFLEFCSIGVDGISKDRNLKSLWLEGKEEPITGKNIVYGIQSPDRIAETSGYKIIAI